jgi:hypothetical protein
MTARDVGGGSPRVAATLKVSLAARDRRAGAVLLAGTIGGSPPFAPPPPPERRGPGELGPVPAERARPRPARRAAPAADAGEEASGGGNGARQRERTAPLPSAPLAGVPGLHGFGVFLGELGSPARVEGAAADGRPAAGVTLGRGLRSVPSLADVSVAIGGLPEGRMSRLAALRALLPRRARRAAPAIATATTEPTRAASPPAPAAAATVPRSPPTPAAAPAAGRLRRASRYIVNGILDVTIRRFRAAPQRS